MRPAAGSARACGAASPISRSRARSAPGPRSAPAIGEHIFLVSASSTSSASLPCRSRSFAVCRHPPHGCWRRCGCSSSRRIRPASRRSDACSCSRPKPLASVFALFLIVLFLSSAAMYVIERDVQPGPFGTLPQALWWAVVTLTTTGYGDKVPLTHLGHLLGAVVMICGIATFGLSTGILATGFAAETRRRNFIQTWDLVSKVPFFQSLDPSAITEITHMLRRLEVPERTAIIRRGKVGDCMYFIAGGRSAGRYQADAGASRRRGVLRRARVAWRFGAHRQCDHDDAVDAPDPRSRRFPHADRAIIRISSAPSMPRAQRRMSENQQTTRAAASRRRIAS